MTVHRFTLTFDLEDGSQRQLRFQPSPATGGWNRIELQRDTPEDPWHQKDVTSVSDLTLEAEPVSLPQGFAGP